MIKKLIKRWLRNQLEFYIMHTLSRRYIGLMNLPQHEKDYISKIKVLNDFVEWL